MNHFLQTLCLERVVSPNCVWFFKPCLFSRLLLLRNVPRTHADCLFSSELSQCVCGGWCQGVFRGLTWLQNFCCVTNSCGDHGKVSVEWVAQNPPSKWHQDILQGVVCLQNREQETQTAFQHKKHSSFLFNKKKKGTDSKMQLTLKVWLRHISLTQEFLFSLFSFSFGWKQALIGVHCSHWCANYS